MNNTTIEVAPINVSAAKDAEANTASILANANELVIKNQNDYETSAEFLKTIKAKYKELDDMRKNITRPLDTVKKSVLDLFRFPLEKLSKAESVIKSTMLKYMDEQERVRREQEAKLQAEAEKKRKEMEEKAEKARAEGKEAKAVQYETRAETITTPVVAPRVDKVNGIAKKTIWRARITDESAIPREWLIPNVEALQKFAVATKGTMKIPGVIFEQETILSAGR